MTQASTSQQSPAIVWFREDLRLRDNPALHAAAASKRPLLCIYIFDEESRGLRAPGGAARWWLHGSLEELQKTLRARDGELLLLRGRAAEVIDWLTHETRAQAVYWNRRYDEPGRIIDAALKTALKQRDIAVESFNGRLLREPWTVMNQAGAPFRVFTAYWRAACQQDPPPEPLPVPRLTFLQLPPRLRTMAVALDELQLRPHAPDWAQGLRADWVPGEAAAATQLKRFLAKGLSGYATQRDRPDLRGTSRLSPYLCAGNLSARQIWHTAHTAVLAGDKKAASYRHLEKYLAELGWREFCYHLLYHQGDLAERNFQARFDAMRWRTDARQLRAWQRGLTGYPIVDAGMRELWTTGWMHNRVRMVTASFLVKHLLLDWRVGEKWFWDTLVDADPANNPANWQWVAGTGADASPYFRIFNPTLQGEKFDPQGDYVRRWVPELGKLPARAIHQPWRASPAELDAAGVELGKTYPHPIVTHEDARRRALERSKSLSKAVK